MEPPDRAATDYPMSSVRLETLRRRRKHDLIQGPNSLSLSSEDIDLLLSSSEIRHRMLALAPANNLTKEQIDRGLSDEAFQVRCASLHNDDHTAEHVMRAINDPVAIVRRFAASSLNGRAEATVRAAADPEAEVRECVLGHWDAPESVISGLRNDPVRDIAMSAVIEAETATESDVRQGIYHGGRRLAMAAALSPALTSTLRTELIRVLEARQSDASLERMERTSAEYAIVTIGMRVDATSSMRSAAERMARDYHSGYDRKTHQESLRALEALRRHST